MGDSGAAGPRHGPPRGGGVDHRSNEPGSIQQVGPSVLCIMRKLTFYLQINSLVIGELPPMMRREAENLLADSGLLGTTIAADATLELMEKAKRLADDEKETGTGTVEADGASVGRRPKGAIERGSGELEEGSQQRWLFSTQQLRLSLAQVLCCCKQTPRPGA